MKNSTNTKNTEVQSSVDLTNNQQSQAMFSMFSKFIETPPAEMKLELIKKVVPTELLNRDSVEEMKSKTQINSQDQKDIKAKEEQRIKKELADKKAGIIVRYEKPIDPELAKKVVETQSRLAEANQRKEVIQRVLMRLYKDRLFTVKDLEDTLAPIVSKWDGDATAIINNALKDIPSVKVIGKERREGRGRLSSIWQVVPEAGAKVLNNTVTLSGINQ